MLIDDLRLVTTLLVRLRNYYPNEITNNEDAACDRMARTIAAHDALAPDWSSAPEWARWCAIDVNGQRVYYEIEPIPDTWNSEWRFSPEVIEVARHELQSDEMGFVDLPIGIDWRLCVWQRPPAQEPGT